MTECNARKIASAAPWPRMKVCYLTEGAADGYTAVMRDGWTFVFEGINIAFEAVEAFRDQAPCTLEERPRFTVY